MHKRYIFGWYRMLFGLLGLAAISTQLFNGVQKDNFSFVNFFSFFTIESNILAVALLLIAGTLTLQGKSSESLFFWRGAATLYMTLTGITYIVLLSGLEESLQLTLPWVNIVLHYIMPAAVLLDWVCNVPSKAITFRRASMWLIFPFAYLVYSLIRGNITGWYPYPFLNPEGDGYLGILLVSVAIAVVLVGLVWLLAFLTRIRRLQKH